MQLSLLKKTTAFFLDDERTTSGIKCVVEGEELVEVLYKENIDIKIIVYSIEDRLQKVRSLFKKFKINAYVCKGRNGLKELEKAIGSVDDNIQYLSPMVDNALQ